jgi:predicted TIM-barrel fold metal-dependent hydrolase
MVDKGENNGRRIVDGHCHVASTDFIPRAFIEGVVDNMLVALEAQGLRPGRTKLIDLYLGQMRDPECDELVSQMADAGIEKAVLLLPDFSYVFRDSGLTIAEAYYRHSLILKKWPGRFFVLAGIDPRWGTDGLELFERGIREFGFSGLKLYPPCGYSPSNKILFPFFEICAQYKLPVVSHTGGTSAALTYGTSRPILIDEASHNFAGVNFILAHGTGAYLEECAMMCAFRPNVFVDVSGYEAQQLERLQLLTSRGINHKLIFGTDWPVFRLQGTQKDLLSSLLSSDDFAGRMRDYELNNFLGATIERLLSHNALNLRQSS